jgi:BirA family biotin operon repressor/biotin-[acetyl-CoA-carboxylase] ligase
VTRVGRAGRIVGRQVIALDDVDSTQSELARLADADAPQGTVVTARHQRQGRGRQGRAWWDEPGQSLLLSVLLRPPVPAAQAPQLSHVAALAVADALGGIGVAAGIRWPNDVVIGGRKMGGILPDAVTDGAGRLRHVLLGIGLNLNQTAFPGPLAATATSLRLATGREHDPTAVLAGLLDALDARYTRYLAGGFAGLRADWRRCAVSLGTMVTTPAGLLGAAEDISPEGALLVRLDDGRLMPLWSGEIAVVARDA